MYRSMLQIYVKNSNQAVEFYQNAFNAKLLCNHQNPDGTVAHAELDIFGQVLAICETLEQEVVTGNSMQFCLHFGEGKEAIVKKAYEALKEDCLALTVPITALGECPWSPCLFGLIDQFGVNWCVYV
ncbi:MAG: VOC family protein [Oscillospiraceae bacterium]|nr:VOC family protein [Oscillospiraceae bacterium]MDD4414766.1 VOC family protein [Oscillospiraceae bacterium]